MSSIGTGYDQSTTTFSPDGRVFQIEYAAKAVENSGTAVGIRCKDGVVLGVEKQKLSKMLVPGSNRRIYTVDKCTGMAVSGMMADARQVRGSAGSLAAVRLSSTATALLRPPANAAPCICSRRLSTTRARSRPTTPTSTAGRFQATSYATASRE